MNYHSLYIGLFLGLPFILNAQDSPTDSAMQQNVVTLATRSHNVQAQEHYRQAVQLEQQSEVSAAIQELDRALAFKYDYQDALWLRARLKHRDEDDAGSLSDYQALLYLAPGRTEARFERAKLLYVLRRYEEAIADFRYLLENSMEETNTVYFRGVEQNLDGVKTFTTQSATTVQSGIEADIWNFMGLCYLELKEFDKANTYFELALTQNTRDPNLYSNLGLSHERTGDTLQAMQYYSEALGLQPNHPVALQNFSYLARKTNRLDLAATIFDQKTTAEEASPQHLLHQGMIRHQQGKYQEAITLYSRAIENSSYEADFYLQRGFSYEKLLQLDKAFQDYTSALQLDESLEKAYLNRGNVLYKQKKLSQALQDYQQALSLNSDNAKVYFNIGLVYHRMKKYDEACSYLEQALLKGYEGAEPIIEKVCTSP